MVGKVSWCSIDASGNDRHNLLFYKKCNFCHLLPFAKMGQYGLKWNQIVFNGLMYPQNESATLHIVLSKCISIDDSVARFSKLTPNSVIIIR